MSEAQQIGKTFAAVLKEWLTPEQFHEMKDWNGQNRDNPCCASHDYCDANMAMCEAFIQLKMPTTDGGRFDTALWDAAWSYARQEGLI